MITKKLLRWSLTGMLMGFLVLVAIPFLVPMDNYKPLLEDRLSRLMKQQVVIGPLKLEILPDAGLRAENISAWSKDAGRGEIFIKAMHLEFDLPRLLFEGIPSIRHIRLTGLATNQRFITSAFEEFSRQGTDEAPFTRLERISANGMTIRMNDGRMLGPYWFNATLTPENTLDRARLGRMDKALKIKMDRAAQGFNVRLAASDWTLPLSPALHFDQLQARGTLDKQGLRLKQVESHAYQGQLEGNAEISWQQGWRIVARTSLNSIRMAPLVTLFGGKGFQGDFSGNLDIRLDSQHPRLLLQDPLVSGDFSIENGIVTGPDGHARQFTFDSFSAHGTLRRHSLTTTGSRLATRNGVITGDTRTTWRPQWDFTADLNSDGIDMEELLAEFSDRKLVSGRLSGRASVNLTGKHFPELFHQPAITGQLQLSRGVLYKTGDEKEEEAIPLFHFDTIRSHIKLTASRLETRDTEIRAYGGHIIGASTLSWGPAWRLQTRMKARGIDSAALLENILDERIISGKFDGQATITLSGPHLSTMLNEPQIHGRFHFSDGVFYKADLERVGMEPSREETTNGQTAFHEFSGRAHIQAGAIRLDAVKLTSSALQASAAIEINPQNQLQGQLTLGFRKTASLTNIPMIISGSIDEPHLRPSNSVLLGGVVGTTLLGPGVGTAVGIKVGEGMGRLLSTIGKGPSAEP